MWQSYSCPGLYWNSVLFMPDHNFDFKLLIFHRHSTRHQLKMITVQLIWLIYWSHQMRWLRFAMIMFQKNIKIVHFVAQIIEVMTRLILMLSFFVFPLVEDSSKVSRNESKSLLPNPISVSGTSHVKASIRFDIYFNILDDSWKLKSLYFIIKME